MERICAQCYWPVKKGLAVLNLSCGHVTHIYCFYLLNEEKWFVCPTCRQRYKWSAVKSAVRKTIRTCKKDTVQKAHNEIQHSNNHLFNVSHGKNEIETSPPDKPGDLTNQICFVYQTQLILPDEMIDLVKLNEQVRTLKKSVSQLLSEVTDLKDELERVKREKEETSSKLQIHLKEQLATESKYSDIRTKYDRMKAEFEVQRKKDLQEINRLQEKCELRSSLEHKACALHSSILEEQYRNLKKDDDRRFDYNLYASRELKKRREFLRDNYK